MKVVISGIIEGNEAYVNKQLKILRSINITHFHFNISNTYNPTDLDKIKKIIEEEFNLVQDIFSNTKKLEYVYARIIYVYYAKKFGLTYREIASKINKTRLGVAYIAGKFNNEIQFNKYFIKKYININNRVEKILTHEH